MSKEMFWHKTVQISEQMYTTSGPAMCFVRWFGLFPITVMKDGHRLFLKWSPWYALYSYVCGIFIAYKGFYDDITIPREKSIRIKVSTDIFVDFSDITAVMMIMICGIFITPLKYATFYQFVNCLNEIDSIIPPKDIKHARKVSLYTLSSLLAGIFVLEVLDTVMYLKTAGERSGDLFVVQTYTPFYVAYHILLIHDGLMWHLIYCIFRRLKLLNNHLKIENFKTKSIKYYEFSSSNAYPKRGFKSTSQIADVVSKAHQQQNGKEFLDVKKRQVAISKLVVVYGKICDVVELSNQLLGLSRTITIMGLLWSLIVIPYLLIVEIAGKRKDPLYIMMYSLWCLVHYGRLILLAQPCYACKEQGKITKNLVSSLLSAKEVDEQYKPQFHEFSMTLLHRQFEFTANGLTNIDRTLLTSLTGTITTYLVILLQFANVQR